eukprot:603135-Rhodomonas_salina.1
MRIRVWGQPHRYGTRIFAVQVREYAYKGHVTSSPSSEIATWQHHTRPQYRPSHSTIRYLSTAHRLVPYAILVPLIA